MVEVDEVDEAEVGRPSALHPENWLPKLSTPKEEGGLVHGLIPLKVAERETPTISTTDEEIDLYQRYYGDEIVPGIVAAIEAGNCKKMILALNEITDEGAKKIAVPLGVPPPSLARPHPRRRAPPPPPRSDQHEPHLPVAHGQLHQGRGRKGTRRGAQDEHGTDQPLPRPPVPRV